MSKKKSQPGRNQSAASKARSSKKVAKSGKSASGKKTATGKKAAGKRTAAKTAPRAKSQPGSDPRFPDSFIHPGATVEGMVNMGPECSIWAGAVLRADMNRIRLGRGVNIQDNTTLHVDSRASIEIGDYTLVGHNAMLHGCTIGRAVMVGIGCIVLDGAEIGDGAMITAGCMIRGGARIPAGALVLQKDGRTYVKEGKARTGYTMAGSLEYIELAQRYRRGEYRPFTREEEEELFRRGEAMLVQMGLKDDPEAHTEVEGASSENVMWT